MIPGLCVKEFLPSRSYGSISAAVGHVEFDKGGVRG